MDGCVGGGVRMTENEGRADKRQRLRRKQIGCMEPNSHHVHPLE